MLSKNPEKHVWTLDSNLLALKYAIKWFVQKAINIVVQISHFCCFIFNAFVTKCLCEL